MRLLGCSNLFPSWLKGNGSPPTLYYSPNLRVLPISPLCVYYPPIYVYYDVPSRTPHGVQEPEGVLREALCPRETPHDHVGQGQERGVTAVG